MLSSKSEMDYCSNYVHKKIQSFREMCILSDWFESFETETSLIFSWDNPFIPLCWGTGLPQVQSATFAPDMAAGPGIRWECAASRAQYWPAGTSSKWVGTKTTFGPRDKSYKTIAQQCSFMERAAAAALVERKTVFHCLVCSWAAYGRTSSGDGFSKQPT